MDISVITPVYNAAKFLEEAVNSALMQPETREVILIEDGSSDNSLELCQYLNRKHEKVRLFQHPNGGNRGASSSRNLGIRMSTANYIAFLDADDFYLKNRFTNTVKLFQNNPSIDGVYGATGTCFTNNQERNNWNKSYRSNITSIKRTIPPNKLFHALLFQTHGRFHTNAITVKKSIFEKTGFFNENLRLHQDSDMWLKMALLGKLIKQENEELISVRRVHAENRITKIRLKDFSSRDLFYTSFYEWATENNLRWEILEKIKYKIWKNRLFLYDSWFYSKQSAVNKNILYRLANAFTFFKKRLINEPDLFLNKFVIWTLLEALKVRNINQLRQAK